MLGGSAYVVGGYDGPALDREVLATTDGSHFRDVAALAVPVRYPAVAVLGRRIYVVGGQSASGAPVDTVQVVDPASHTASVVGRLPLPLAGAVAATLDGTVYVAGGDTGTSAGSLHPVAGVLAFRPSSGTFLAAGSLREAVGYAGAAVTGGRLWIVGGEGAGGPPTAAVQMLEPNRAFGAGRRERRRARPSSATSCSSPTGATTASSSSTPPDAGLWTYPSSRAPAPPGGFYFPDDAFFIRHGTAIISNQEENETIVEIAYPFRAACSGPTATPAAPGRLRATSTTPTTPTC